MVRSLEFPSTFSLELCAYSDVGWDNNVYDHKSTTGYCIFLADSLIPWKGKKHDVVSHSSTKYEYWAMVVSTCEIVCLRWLLADMSVRISHPTPLHYDNESAITITKNSVSHELTKHIEIYCHFTCHHFQQGTIYFHHLSSIMQNIDIFTKALTTQWFNFFF